MSKTLNLETKWCKIVPYNIHGMFIYTQDFTLIVLV